MKVDLKKSVADRKLHLSKHVTSNRKPQLFILKSLSSNVQVFLTTVVLFDATKSHNYNSFIVRILRVVCPVEQKGDIRNYHQVKTTASNIFFTWAGPNLCENIKLLVHLFIMSQKKKKLSCLWQERLFNLLRRNGATSNSCISLSWCCKMLKNPSRFPWQPPTFLSVNCAVKFLFQTKLWYTGSLTWRHILFFFVCVLNLKDMSPWSHDAVKMERHCQLFQKP